MKRFMNKTERKIQYFLLALMVILLALAMINQSYAQSSNIKKIQDVQYEYSHAKWKKDQPKKRKKAVKYAVKVNGKNSKESRTNRRLNRKIEAIRQRIK